MHNTAQTGKTSRAERLRLEEVARVKSLLIRNKLTLTQIDQQYDLPSGTAGNTVHEPHLAGERAIAAALKTRPHLLWRSRYYPDGSRKNPQPAENYRNGRRQTTDAQHQSQVAA
ncbi:helix-turn-helix domain-containing protein [Rhizobium paknamense]|uniref:Ner family transcriptional regulator n=1 Tax=Rhizobium paknamense TaxID=1206817 RepID=A0ABU0I8W5_9HYPH|nr:helix-turn-helix domain-containing protein [Rhizobium paknamense]MDQ0454676.1 Ner family transcriptional regulator [Rhizobium paknamense]